MKVWVVHEVSGDVIGIFRDESDAASVAAIADEICFSGIELNRWHLFDDDELRAIETAAGHTDGTAADRLLVETRVELVRRGLA